MISSGSHCITWPPSPVLAVPGSPGTDLLLQQGAEALDPAAADLDGLVRRLADAPAQPDSPPPPAQLSLW